MSGSVSRRFFDVMPIARSLPSLISATELPMAPQTIGTWLPSTDCVIGPPPANGTVTKSTLRSCLSCSIDSDGVVPVPGEPTLYLPGSFFIRSTSSFMFLAGKLGLTSQEFGEPPALVTGIRSFSTSNGILVYRLGLTVMLDEER